MTAYNPRDEMFARVVLASSTTLAPSIYTLHLRYPRPIHGEVMTHRAFGRNARSSRAVPVKTMLEEVRTRPFIPWHWGRNQKGMQASEECDTEVHNWLENLMPVPERDQFLSREDAWLQAADAALQAAEALSEAGYHKQIVNRLLEPFSWIDTLVTATDWANFDWLRDDRNAEPHMRDLAQMVIEARRGAELEELKPGRWHLPYITDADWTWVMLSAVRNTGPLADILCKVSAARCARISYAPFDGSAATDYERELARYDLLVGDGTQPVHASPLEHQATPDERCADDSPAHPWLSGNLAPGWIQYRKTVAGEYRPG